mmetsp:Transcript_29552/g.84786  ORF Transcript_29552/g.84786 Transcript_29552/m.84786 type:complete len:210 (-) Transcript_29552:83-712(-)
MRTGSRWSCGSLTMSVSIVSMTSRMFEMLSLRFLNVLMWVPTVLTCLSKSTQTCCRSRAMAGPRSLVQPLKNTSVLIFWLPYSSSMAKRSSRSFIGMPSWFTAFLTLSLFIIASNSCSSKSPELSVSASLNICSKEAMVLVSFFCFSLVSFCWFSRALLKVLSTTAPMIVLSNAREATQMNTMKNTIIALFASTNGHTNEPDHLSRVKT